MGLVESTRGADRCEATFMNVGSVASRRGFVFLVAHPSWYGRLPSDVVRYSQPARAQLRARAASAPWRSVRGGSARMNSADPRGFDCSRVLYNRARYDRARTARTDACRALPVDHRFRRARRYGRVASRPPVTARYLCWLGQAFALPSESGTFPHSWETRGGRSASVRSAGKSSLYHSRTFGHDSVARCGSVHIAGELVSRRKTVPALPADEYAGLEREVAPEGADVPPRLSFHFGLQACLRLFECRRLRPGPIRHPRAREQFPRRCQSPQCPPQSLCTARRPICLPKSFHWPRHGKRLLPAGRLGRATARGQPPPSRTYPRSPSARGPCARCLCIRRRCRRPGAAHGGSVHTCIRDRRWLGGCEAVRQAGNRARQPGGACDCRELG